MSELSLPLFSFYLVTDSYTIVLLRLGAEVVWTNEKDCFAGFLRELAFFNTPEPIPGLAEGEGEQASDSETMETQSNDVAETKKKKEQMAWQVKHVVFPAMMRYLVPPQSLAEGGKDNAAVVHVASLENLYKVFERC